MKPRSMIAAAILSTASVAAGSAAAYTIDFRGATRASPQLKLDLTKSLSRYAKATTGCSMIFSVNTTVMPRGYNASSPVYRRGGHYELWDANVCAKKQMFVISMWPSPRGGTDFAIAPQRQRPLHS